MTRAAQDARTLHREWTIVEGGRWWWWLLLLKKKKTRVARDRKVERDSRYAVNPAKSEACLRRDQGSSQGRPEDDCLWNQERSGVWTHGLEDTRGCNSWARVARMSNQIPARTGNCKSASGFSEDKEVTTKGKTATGEAKDSTSKGWTDP